jgi:carboxypeptidase PM20D1
MIKRLAGFVVLLIVVLLAVCVVRAVLLKPRKQEAASITALAFDENAAITRFAGAIKIQTISQPLTKPDQPAMLAFRNYLESNFPHIHAAAKREVVGDGSLLFTWQGTDPSLAPILLMGHMDVVPVDSTSLSKWKHPPFSGEIADGYIWGRGASDDKAAVLSILEAADTLAAGGFKPKRTLIFAFGDDEENDGNGAEALAALLKSRGVHPEFVMDEGGFVARGLVPGVKGDVALVSIAEKGIASVQLQVDSPGGHSSRPPVKTAIGVLSRAMARLEEQQMTARISPVLGQMLDAIAPSMSFGNRLVVANRWLFSPLLIRSLATTPSGNALVRTTTALTMMNAGVKDNVLPTQATAVVNFRILPGDTVQAVLDHVHSVVNDSDIRISLYPTTAGEPSPISPTDSAGFKLLQQTVNAYFPDAPVTPNLLVARTDSVHYYQITPDVYRFFPAVRDETDIEAVHGINERMGTAAYVKAVQFMAAMMRGAQ